MHDLLTSGLDGVSTSDKHDEYPEHERRNEAHDSVFVAVLVCSDVLIILGCLHVGSEFAPQTTGNGRGGGVLRAFSRICTEVY